MAWMRTISTVCECAESSGGLCVVACVCVSDTIKTCALVCESYVDVCGGMDV